MSIHFMKSAESKEVSDFNFFKKFEFKLSKTQDCMVNIRAANLTQIFKKNLIKCMYL